MSTRISLSFRESLHSSPNDRGLKVVRLIAGVRFLGATDWSKVYDGMKDFLVRSVLHCDYPSRNAYIEFP